MPLKSHTKRFIKIYGVTITIYVLFLVFLYLTSTTQNAIPFHRPRSHGDEKVFERNPAQVNQLSKKTRQIISKSGIRIPDEGGPQEDLTLTESELNEYLEENCDEEIGAIRVRLDKNPDVVLPMNEYKRQLAKNFTMTYSNSYEKKDIPSTLTPFLEKGLNPKNGLKDIDLDLDMDAMLQDLKREILLRIRQGDKALFHIPEVVQELRTSKFSIPNIVHFIWFDGASFEVHNYVAIVGAWRYQKPAVILFHCDSEPDSPWWLAAKKKCRSVLKIVKRTKPIKIYGHRLKHVEHQSDIARLQILMEVGGIYLDTDSVILKSVDDFRNHEMVIGQPHREYAAENAIMFANKDSWFLKRWYYEYHNYKESWGFNSLEVPGSIAHYYPNTVFVTFLELCRPHFLEINMIYNGLFNWDPIFVMHLFQRQMPWKERAPLRTLKQLAVLNSTYGEVSRHVIWGDKKMRNVTDWIVTCDLEKFLEI